jgi:NAD+ synthase (glutamine-hydrolysing)
LWSNEDVESTPYGFVRVGAATPKLRVAEPEANASELVGLIRAATGHGVQILVLPELALTGYTAGDLFFSRSVLVEGAERALARLLRETADTSLVVALGLPLAADGRLFNCAAVAQGGHLLGVVPKTYLPNYREFYEERWFAGSRDAVCDQVTLAGARVPFGSDLLFHLEHSPEVSIGVEICEDLWAPVPPSSLQAVAGANVLLNLSASNETVAKADYRRALVAQQSGRAVSAYALAASGVHESTTDVVFGGHLMIAENGVLLAEGQRFQREAQLVSTEVDLERLTVERLRLNSFADSTPLLSRTFRRVTLAPIPAAQPFRLTRTVDPLPFVPSDPATLDARCEEIFSIQTSALARRLEHLSGAGVVIGLSGGLDSTLALLVAARTFDLLGRLRSAVHGVTLPGFGTTALTLGNARRLAACVGATLSEIDIRPACERHIADIGLDPSDRASTTYQNLQARERTQVLMDLANKEGAILVGTGDLSELALGWCTFGGDHMAMYNVNGGVPKTLVRRLVQWVAAHRASEAEREVLLSVLATPVSPELVPPAADGSIGQKTEELLGPYELHDFFLHHFFRGAGPRKLLFLAEHAFAGRHDREALRRTLRTFVERFFAQQYKRSCLPDGPKVGSVSLSPRGDWRMPSDVSAAAWLAELD